MTDQADLFLGPDSAFRSMELHDDTSVRQYLVNPIVGHADLHVALDSSWYYKSDRELTRREEP